MTTLDYAALNLPYMNSPSYSFEEFSNDLELTADGIFRRTVPPLCPECGVLMSRNGYNPYCKKYIGSIKMGRYICPCCGESLEEDHSFWEEPKKIMTRNKQKNKVWDIIYNIVKDLPSEYKLIFGLLLVFLTSGIGSTIYGIINEETTALYLTFFSYVVAVISAIIIINKKASLDREEIRRLEEKRINMKLYLIGKPKSFNRSDKTYICKYWIFNEETGDRKESPSFKPRWEAGFLTIDIKDVGVDDMIAAQVKNTQKDIWECDYFLTRAHTTEAKLLENNGKEESTHDSKN